VEPDAAPGVGLLEEPATTASRPGHHLLPMLDRGPPGRRALRLASPRHARARSSRSPALPSGRARPLAPQQHLRGPCLLSRGARCARRAACGQGRRKRVVRTARVLLAASRATPLRLVVGDDARPTSLRRWSARAVGRPIGLPRPCGRACARGRAPEEGLARRSSAQIAARRDLLSAYARDGGLGV
jgi:hypothetical protein